MTPPDPPKPPAAGSPSQTAGAPAREPPARDAIPGQFDPQQVVEEITFQDAASLMAELSPVHERWRPSEDWIFRGLADADWELIPSVLRRDPPRTGLPTWTRVADPVETAVGGGRDYLRTQVEARLIIDFMVAADRAGLAVPDDHFIVRAWRAWAKLVGAPPVIAWGTGIPVQGKPWPPHEVLATVGLAQHYGIPTRLLDWTWKPRVAAYFAAEDALVKALADGSLAVWALNQSFVQIAWLHEAEPSVEIVSAPQAGNPNLAAQAGLFTVARHAHEDIGFDKILAGAPLQNAALLRPRPLRKLILPHTEAGRLLELLAIEGVSAAVVYPGYGGVVRSIQERREFFPKRGGGTPP